MLEKEVIHIEYCSNCKAHNWCANHSEEKYRQCFTTISKAIQTKFPKITIKGNVLPNNYVPIKISENKYYDAARSKYVYFPAVGAFEITFRSQLLYSKKKNNAWPDPQTIIDKLHKIFEKSKKQDYQLDENTDGETTVNMNSQNYLNHNDNRKTFTKINKKQPFSMLSRKIANEQLYGEFEKLQANHKNYEHEKINQQNLPLQFFQGKTIVQDSTGKKEIIIKLDSIQQEPGVETIKRAPSKKELINEWNTELKQLQNKFNRFQQKVKKIHNYQNIVSTNRDKSLKNSRSIQSSQINEKSIHNANSRLAEKIMDVNEIYGNHAFLQKFYNNVKLRKIQEYVHASQEEKNMQLKKIYGMGDKYNRKFNHQQIISQDESQEDNLRQYINCQFKKKKIARGSGQISREKLSGLNNKHKSLQYQQNQFRIREKMQNKQISVDKNMRNKYQINEQGKQQNKSELYVRNKSKLQSTMQIKNRKQSQSLSKNDKNLKFPNSIQKNYRSSKNMQKYQIINGKFDPYKHIQNQQKTIKNPDKNFTGKVRDSNANYPLISNTQGSPYSDQKYSNSRIIKKSKNSFNKKTQNVQNIKFKNYPSNFSVRQSKQSKNSQINNRQSKDRQFADQRKYQQEQNIQKQSEEQNENQMKQQESEQDHTGNDNMLTIKLRENQDQSIDESNADQKCKGNENKHQDNDEQYQQQKQNIQQHKSKRLYDSIHHQKSWRHFYGDSKLLQRHNRSILSQTSRNYPKQNSLSVKENQTQRKSLFHYSASKMQKSNRKLKNSRFNKSFQKQEKIDPIKSNRQKINDQLKNNSKSLKNQKIDSKKSKRTNNNTNSKRSNHKEHYEENLNIYGQPDLIEHKSNNSRIKIQQSNNVAQNNKQIIQKIQQPKIKSKTTKNLNPPFIEKTKNISISMRQQDLKIKQKSLTTQQPKSINYPTNSKQMKNKQKTQSMIAKKSNSIISEKSIKIKQQKMKAPNKAKINSVQNLSSIKTVRQYSLEENLNPKDNVGAQARSSQNSSSQRSHAKQTKNVGIQKNHYTCKFIQTDIQVDPIISITQQKNNNQNKNIEQEQINTRKEEIEQQQKNIKYPKKCNNAFKNERAFILNNIFGQQITQQSEDYLKTVQSYKIDSQIYPQQEIKPQFTKWAHLTKIMTKATLFDNKSLKSGRININEKNQNYVKIFQMLCFKNQFIILRLFQNAKTWKNGMFGVWLCHHYQWKCVKINDLVPIGQSQQPQCTIHQQNQYWPTILEKALAVLVGGYRQLYMLTTGQIFHLLTGSNYLQFKIREDATKNEKLIRFLSENQKKNFIIHAQKTFENLEQQSKMQNTIYYLLNTKIIDENQQLIRIKENNKEPVWIKLQKFASIFHHAEVLMLRVHHNFVQCPLKSTQNSIFVIYQLAFTENLFGCLTISSHLCTNLKVYLYRDEGQSVLRLIGQASQKNKKQLFFDCCFNEGKYYLFVESGNVEIRLTYFGEGNPNINLKQSVRQQDLKNQYIQYVPLKELPKNSPQKSVPKFLSSLSSSGFKNSLQSNSRINKRNSLNRLRQHFIQYLLAKK